MSGADGEALGLLREMRDLGKITAPMLMETFPRWRVFESGGIWWALRSGSQATGGPESLLRLVIGAPDLIGLADKLCLQEHLDALATDELAAVWRDAALPAVPPAAEGEGGPGCPR